MSGSIYALNVQCSGGCMKSVMGPARTAEEEFSLLTLSKFFGDLFHLGWRICNGAWNCGDSCLGAAPWVHARKMKTPPRNYKIKTVNPEFFGKCSVANL